MNKKQKQTFLLVFLVILLFTINYSFIDSFLINFLDEGEIAHVQRVIDGDTIVIENKTSVRLLGINSPERGELYYSEAKEFLEEMVLNRTVKLEFGKSKYDKYHRILAYIFINGKNVNLELVRKGFANFYFPSGRDVYYDQFKKAWEDCIEDNLNLCEKSKDKCGECIELKEFDYKNEVIILYNKCSFDCELTNWKIKDEGRKNFVFPKFVLESGKNLEIIVSKESRKDTSEKIFWEVKTYIWTKSGDTLFLRDDKGKLVLWESY
jgi:micrococcal nuclease